MGAGDPWTQTEAIIYNIIGINNVMDVVYKDTDGLMAGTGDKRRDSKAEQRGKEGQQGGADGTGGGGGGGAHSRVGVGLGVVELDAGEDGVVETHVHRHDGEVDRVGLVRLQRRGDGEVRARVAVEDVYLAMPWRDTRQRSQAQRGEEDKKSGEN